MNFRGKIVRAGQVILPSVSGTMNEKTSAGGFRVWEGQFTVPAGEHIAPSDDCELVLDDGRSTGLRILSISASATGPTTAQFKSNGPLA
jgi:hypothetical protein